jgi:hypothetical protein
MKKILVIFMVLMALTACKDKKKVEKPVDDFLKVPSYETTTPVSTPSIPVPQIVYVDRATNQIVNDSTYWYVVALENKGKEGKITWHGTVVLPTQYFDFLLARKEFEQATGNLFFDFILKIDRESCRSYERYSTYTYSK